VSRDIDIGKIITKLKHALFRASIVSEVLIDFMIISEVWVEDSIAHIVAWIPDLDPKSGKLKYRKKHITYDLEKDMILGIKDEKG